MTETQFQILVFKWFKSIMKKYPKITLAYHIPNEGKRSRREAAIMKKKGLKKGAPDIVLPFPIGVFGAMYIELKIDDGIISQEQHTYLAALQEVGNFVVICRSLDEVKLAVSQYLSDVVV